MRLETTISSTMKDIGNDIEENTLFWIIEYHAKLSDNLGQRPNDDYKVCSVFIANNSTNFTKDNFWTYRLDDSFDSTSIDGHENAYRHTIMNLTIHLRRYKECNITYMKDKKKQYHLQTWWMSRERTWVLLIDNNNLEYLSRQRLLMESLWERLSLPNPQSQFQHQQKAGNIM